MLFIIIAFSFCVINFQKEIILRHNRLPYSTMASNWTYAPQTSENTVIYGKCILIWMWRQEPQEARIFVFICQRKYWLPYSSHIMFFNIL